MTIEEQVRSALRARAELVQPSDDGWDRTRAGSLKPGPSVGRRIAAALLAAVVAVGGLALLVLAFDREPSHGPAQSNAQGPAGKPTPLDVRSFRIPGPAGAIAAGDGWVWVVASTGENGNGSIERIDPLTGVSSLSIPIPDTPTYLAAGAGFVWVPLNPSGGGRSTLLQFDGETGSLVHRFPGLYGPVVAATDGTMWAVGGSSTDQPEIVHVDPDSQERVATIRVAEAPVDMVEAAGSIWALTLPELDGLDQAQTLLRVDTRSGETLRRFDFQSGGLWLAGSERGVWLSAGWPDQRATSTMVPAAGADPTPFGDVYNFRPFAADDLHVWFIAGPHDGGARGICGINLETQAIDACGDDDVGPDLEAARDSAAFERTTNTLWVGVYLQPLITRVGPP